MIEATQARFPLHVVPLDPSTPQLLRCEDEAIRIPGSIQTHGFLLLLDEAGQVIVASENAVQFLGVAADRILGASLETLLGREISAALRAALASTDPAGLVSYLGDFQIEGDFYCVVTHLLDAGRVLEFESLDKPVGSDLVNAILTNFVGELSKVGSEKELFAAITKQMMDLTGFNRILLYSFDEAGHGTVLSEENDGTLPSYLGLRFPASDIPPQARELYLLNTMRCIPDAGYVPSPLRGMPSVATKDLDLSQSVLRSVSPIHLEYMRNMGTMSTMSISIVCDGQLWGLISAHNALPRRVPFLIRSACDLLTKIVAAQMRAYRAAAQFKTKVEFQAVHRRLLTQMAAENNYVAAMESQMDDLMRVTNAGGVALLVGDRLERAGGTPDEAALRRLAGWLDQQPEMEIFESRELGRDVEAMGEWTEVASGMIAMRISDVKRSYILWFRPEVVRTVTWAGEPMKPEVGAVRLHPRLSFASWKETERGKSEAWTATEIESASEFRTAVQKIFLKRAEEAEHLSEERFQQLTNAIPILVWTADDRGNLTFVNQRWREQGLTERGPWFDAGGGANEYATGYQELWERAVSQGVPFEEEVRLRAGPEGVERWNLVRAVPFTRADGTRAGWVGTCTDLTGRRQRELAASMSEKLALTGRLTNVIAHEINNPLAAITNVLFLLRGMVEGNAVAQDYLGMAESELERISAITKQTFRWGGETVYRAEWTAAGLIFDASLRLFTGKIRNRMVTVTLIGGAQVRVYGVSGELRQVLANLLSNALDAVPVGGRVGLEARYTTEGSELIVSDAGTGMSEETLRQIFQPFYSTKGDFGNGLALYVSKGIVERHGGDLRVESELGKGTTVRARLPFPDEYKLKY